MLMAAEGALNHEDDLMQGYQQKVSSHLQQASKEAITSGFKGIINKFCAFFNIKPLFITGAAIVDAAVHKIKDMTISLKIDALTKYSIFRNSTNEEASTLMNENITTSSQNF